MAILIPTIEQIQNFKVQPTAGEWALLRFLECVLNDEYEVYFNPYMNEDRPDVVIMRKGGGVMIIEVKDWNFGAYELDDKKQWVEQRTKYIVKSPISQVLKYKDNLFELHIESLLPLKVVNIKYFNTVTCAVYFHNASHNDISKKLIEPYSADKKYKDFLKYNVDLLGYDDLNAETFNKILYDRWLSRKSYFFKDDIYERMKEFLQPTIHMISDGIDINYSKKQLEIIHSETKEQRIKGVMGSGKTTVLAARAVRAYKRALKSNPEAKVLILTFNITLRNFIRDKINQVREEFPWNIFVINNYHQFVKSELNNYGIDITVPSKHSDPIAYIDNFYYSNPNVFEQVKDKIKKYDVILIDEIQDYKRPWMDLIKNNFLAENGEYILFGDVKQNIYGNITEVKDVSTNVRSRPIELKTCYRSDFKVRDLAVEFQKRVFQDKYDIDEFNTSNGDLTFAFEKEGYLNYIYLEDTDSVSSLFTIVNSNVINKKDGVARNDITVLGYNIKDLRRFDAYYRHVSHEKTNSMFAGQELIYLDKLNKLNYIKDEWIDAIYKGVSSTQDKQKTLARLLTIYGLFDKYEDKFKPILMRKCNDVGCDYNYFIDCMVRYKPQIDEFREAVMSADTKKLDRNKKLHFNMNRGSLKISTIHSFKGWESKAVFLILDKYSDNKSTFDELLYTGITRCCSNLMVINYGNKEYDEKIKPIIRNLIPASD